MKAECVQKVRPSRRLESGKSKLEAAAKVPMTEGQVKRLEELVRSMEITRDLPAKDVREFNSATEDNNKEPLLIHAIRSTYLDFLLVRNLAANVLRNHGVHLQDSDRLSMMTSYKRALLLTSLPNVFLRAGPTPSRLRTLSFRDGHFPRAPTGKPITSHLATPSCSAI